MAIGEKHRRFEIFARLPVSMMFHSRTKQLRWKHSLKRFSANSHCGIGMRNSIYFIGSFAIMILRYGRSYDLRQASLYTETWATNRPEGARERQGQRSMP